MCIRYSAEATKELKARKTEMTVYKIYRVKNCAWDDKAPLFLASPYRDMLIRQGGTIHAFVPTEAKKPPIIGSAGFTVKGGFDYIRRKDLRSYEAREIDAYGIHCFLSRKGALAFKAAHCNWCDHVVVPLKVNTEDLIIAGHEKYDVKYNEERWVATATFKKVTLLPATYKKHTTRRNY